MRERKQPKVKRRLLNERLELLEERTLPTTFTVSNLNDSGAGSLRQAIIDANTAAGADTIVFNTVALTGPGPITAKECVCGT
jgi:hypothetical protein